MGYLNKKILNYNLTNLIGEGGMAFVYLGVHERLEKKVAVKVLNPMLSANAQIRARFENEAKIMSSLEHANIVKVIDYCDQEGTLAIIMELLEGRDLSDTIKANGAIDVNNAIPLFINILDAFIYAHNKGIVHRDIKPGNIFIEKGNRVKILDFGIAKLFGTGLDKTSTGTQMGTPIYMSPEQVKGEKSIDHRSDIYSLGVTFYFMLKGKAPYNSDTESSFEIFNKIVFEPLPELIEYPELNEIIKKAVAKDRNHRFQDVDSFKLALEQIYNGDGELISKKNRPPEIPKKPEIEQEKSTNPRFIFNVFFIISLLLLVIIYFKLLFFDNNNLTQNGDANPTYSSDTIQSMDEVTIGNQIWTSKNLDVETYRNGEAIPQEQDAAAWKNLTTGAWCYYENKSANGSSYAKLYNWYAVNDPRGLAPNGYHIPSDEEWTTLTNYLGGISEAGTKMKSSSGWQNNGNGTNTSGFAGLPGGYRNSNGLFYSIGAYGFWWSSSESSPYQSWYLTLFDEDYGGDLEIGTILPKQNGFSVRCLRD